VKSGGFSLVELMVSLALLAILSSVAAPSFLSSIRTQHTRSVADQIFADVYWAKEEAIKRHEDITIGFADDGWTISKADTTRLKLYANQYSDVTVRASANLTFDGVRGLTGGTTITVTSSSGTVTLDVVQLGFADICSNNIPGYKKC
jgi:prepilin-type N-terminal cleavage/methylation domain-containing protein